MAGASVYDLIVVGAGPAGSTLATLVKLRRPEARVLILDRCVFPRHHIGESLLPGSIPVLKEMGVFDKINAGGFPRKMGAVFVWGKDREPWDADFNNLNLEMVQKYGRALDTEFSWQVLRSKYDEILLRHAESCGVEARLGWRASAALEEGGVIRGVEVEGPDGRRETLRARVTADCSGQAGFLAAVRRTRRYRDDLRNVAGYSYFKGARWKFKFAGHPDKTKIFVCSVPEGWFWYIPLAEDVVSVGLVSKAEHVKRSGIKDMRAYYDGALSRCKEIRPLLREAKRLPGMDPADAAKDFFTAGDWSYENGAACGPGWLAAGDAAFFLDPLLSSGVMMAHLSGHRAAYTVLSAWDEKSPDVSRALWKDYDRYCKEIAGSFLALVRYWYGNDANARAWWKRARAVFEGSSSLGISDKMSFVAIAAGITYHFERAYTSQTLLFGSSGAEHTWQWEGTKLELKRWTRQILAIVDTGFMKKTARDAKVRRAEAMVGLRSLGDAWVPKWSLPRKLSVTFLPEAATGRLRPIQRLDIAKGGPEAAADPKRTLPASYVRILRLIDGKRDIGQIKRAMKAAVPLPADVIDGQVFRLVKDLSVVGALRLERKPGPGRAGPLSGRAGLLRGAESDLKAGRVDAAERALDRAILAGLEQPWAYALRGEARRHLGRLEESGADLDRAVAALEGGGRAAGRGLAARMAEFDAALSRSWVEDRVRIFRANLRLARGDSRGVLEDADAALKLNPRQSEALVLRAKAASALGRLEEARADLKAALAIETEGKRHEG
jgi:flavin-dependent dehydrogenase